MVTYNFIVWIELLNQWLIEMCKKEKKNQAQWNWIRKQRLSGTFLAFKLKLQKTCLTVFLSYQSF